MTITAENVKFLRMIHNVAKWDRWWNEHLFRESKIIPTVEVIKTNKFWLYGLVVVIKEDHSVINAAQRVTMTGKRLRWRPRLHWRNDDHHYHCSRHHNSHRWRFINIMLSLSSTTSCRQCQHHSIISIQSCYRHHHDKCCRWDVRCCRVAVGGVLVWSVLSCYRSCIIHMTFMFCALILIV